MAEEDSKNEIEIHLKAMEKKKNDAIKQLLLEKEALENSPDAQSTNVKEKIEHIKTAIDCIEEKHNEAKAKLLSKFKGSQASLDNIEKEVADVEKNIQELQEERTKALNELSEKKKELKDRLRSLENLDAIINDLNDRIRCNNTEFEDKMQELEKMREQLLASELTDSNEAFEKITDIEKQTADQIKQHKNQILIFQKQKQQLQKVYAIKFQMLKKLKDQCQLSESTDESSSTVYSDERQEPNNDTLYLKNTLGPALSLGLAEMLAKRPSDPIHYLAHFLFKYRHNVDALEIKQREFDELLEERERLADEMRKRQLQMDAYNAILDMLNAAHEDAEKRANFLTLQLFQEQDGEEGGEELSPESTEISIL